MRLLLASMIASVVTAEENHPIRQSLVDRINNGNHKWTAAPVEENPLATYSLDEIKGMMGVQQVDNKSTGLRSGIEVGEIPDVFDGRTRFSSCQKAVRHQADCGSCWAFGAAETLTTNLCILGLGNPVLSPQDLVSCDSTNHGCKGGNLARAWDYIDEYGLRSDECLPYTAGNGKVDACTAGCASDGSSTAYKCPVMPTILDSDQEIQAAVMTVGAVEVAFYVMEDFMNYKGGIYSYKEGKRVGGHAVKIVGWGKDLDTFFWIVQNSWGPNWGEKGFFRIENWHDDRTSAFALGGGFACVQGPIPTPPAPGPTPAPPAPAPPNPPVTCKDIAGSYCKTVASTRSKCKARSYLIPVCRETCGCCDAFPPEYCSSIAEILI